MSIIRVSSDAGYKQLLLPTDIILVVIGHKSRVYVMTAEVN